MKDEVNQQKAIHDNISRCPICKHVLYQRRTGLVCKNHRCKLYWKYCGWAFTSNCFICKKNIKTKKEIEKNTCISCMIKWSEDGI